MAKKSKKAAAEKEVEIPAETAAKESTPRFFESSGSWRTASILILLIASALRLFSIGLKPFHHDEGVNGFFLITLARQHVYHYDPSNYHGPTLYFLALASSFLFGLNDFAVRFVTALFGILIVAGVLSLRRHLGSAGALAAALFVALSPGMTFISRYFIHEMLFVFFTFAVVLGVVKFIDRDRLDNFAIAAFSILLTVCQIPAIFKFANYVGAGNENLWFGVIIGLGALAIALTYFLVRALIDWRAGLFVYLLLASASAALAFATKETAFISFGTIIIAIIATSVWRSLLGNKTQNEFLDLNLKTFRQKLGSTQNTISLIVLCLCIFAYVCALFFSSFFTYSEGLRGAFEAYNVWTKTGSTAHTQNGTWAYLKWLWQVESALLLLGALGAAIALWQAKHKFAIFTAFWAFGLLAAYTLIPYKTPWLAVNFILPLAMIAGYGINELSGSRVAWQRYAAAFLAAAAIGLGAYQCVELNFYRYDDAKEPYVYAHSKRELLDLTGKIKRVAIVSGKNNETSIFLVSPDYWPLPWYLRDYKNVGFYGKITPTSTAEVVIGSMEQEAELETVYASNYTYLGLYPLRPGVDLMLYVRKDLAEKLID